MEPSYRITLRIAGHFSTDFSLLLLSACAASPQPAAPALRDAFSADPQATIAQVSQMDDPIAQEAVVIDLCETFPGYTAQLCAALSDGPARDRCERFNARPHLWSITDQTPSSGRLGLPSGFLASWEDTPAQPGECAPSAHACLEARVQALAEKDALEAVAATCRAYADARLQNDCFFAASEQVPYGADLYARAMPLCAGSGRYAHECHGHVLLRMRADDPAPLSADRLLAEEQAIAHFWADRDPAFGQAAADLYWATVASRALGTAEPFPAVLAASLPERVQPHVRSAVALRVINADDPIAAAQAAMRGQPAPLEKAFMPPVMPEARLWLGDPSPERIYFNDVRGGQRPVHADPDIDLHLAVMTAVAMRNPPRRDVLERLRSDPRPPVQQGAARLLRELAP